jgi:HEAT repeat protein
MRHLILASLALPLGAGIVSGQSLADRVSGAAQPRVQFTFAAREEVCGNGRSYYSIGGHSYYGSYNDADRREPCVNGPVRVLIDRAGRDVVSISTFVGPVPESIPGVTDLGRVRTRDAADYRLGLAERGEGRVSREAITPAMIADSVDATARLLAIARNQNAPRGTRRSAIEWIARPMNTQERAVRDIAGALVAIAGDENENQSVRQQSLRSLARLEHGAGTTQLLELARDARRTWLAREALSALNASGDPRARQYLREVVRAASMPDDVLASAIKAVGGEYATGEDIRMLRDTYARLPGNRSREAAMSAIATFGGADNVRWLLALAGNAEQPPSVRPRAVRQAYQAGAPVSELIKIYDETTDTQLKDAIMSTLAESGDKQATDKLMLIAQKDESPQMRRKAINVLGRSSDERVKKFLVELAGR